MSLTKQDLKEIQESFIDIMAPYMESMELRFEGIDNRFDNLDSAVKEHTNQIKNLQYSVDTLTSKVDDIDGRLMAVENDIKDIYIMLTGDNRFKVNSFSKKPLEVQVLEAYKSILAIAKEAHIKLPS